MKSHLTQLNQEFDNTIRQMTECLLSLHETITSLSLRDETNLDNFLDDLTPILESENIIAIETLYQDSPRWRPFFRILYDYISKFGWTDQKKFEIQQECIHAAIAAFKKRLEARQLIEELKDKLLNVEMLNEISSTTVRQAVSLASEVVVDSWITKIQRTKNPEDLNFGDFQFEGDLIARVFFLWNQNILKTLSIYLDKLKDK